MMQEKLFVFFMIVVASSWCMMIIYAESKLPQQEVDALREIADTMGVKYWDFDGDSCTIRRFEVAVDPPDEAESSVECRCGFANDTLCHVVRIVLKYYSLPGTLSPALAQLPYIDSIDFAYNYLSGTIPQEWASTKLTNISLVVNRLSGEIPTTLAKMTSLMYLGLEANQFSGRIPPDLGYLVNLQTLMLSSNQLIGELPSNFARLTNLTDFRINDNNLNGTIPEFIQNWKNLQRLELHASGLAGPIPSQISVLSGMTQLRISDIKGPPQPFPNLVNMTNLNILVLRSCNIYGEIPPYMWTMQYLGLFDVSFNQLVGEIPSLINQKRINFVFLTGNLLSGQVPEAILKEGTTVDLSYNNLSWQSSQQPACQENMNLNLNLFRSFSAQSNESQLPCLDTFRCPRYYSCLHVNCGGKDAIVHENKRKFIYKGDGDVPGGAAKFYLNPDGNWGFSSTGDFMDDNDYQNIRYSVPSQSSNLSEPYATARSAPTSITYFHYCLENGMYTLNLGFAEIFFTNDNTFKSLGKRFFDIYVQDKLIWKDYNIEVRAGGALKPAVEVHNVSVSNHILEIRLYFAGKGTTRIPRRGVYGPLISAISITSNPKGCPSDKKDKTAYIVVGVVLGTSCLLLLILFVLWWRYCTRGKLTKGIGHMDLSIQDLQSGTFPLKQITAATKDFDEENKIGEGGFGCVYKGQLADGTVIAVKQLSSKSRQGNREFLNEIGMISCLQHPNLVKLHGCCIERDQLLLVYEYMENNSLARALFGPEKHRLKLDWQTRCKICIGIAKGLAFLHEESRLKIVHRDIKATNVLLDRDLNPKISDFGLARLGEEGKTHISTRVAGTIGYMAPEYALWGYLTYKADVYSFGVVVLEIVSGKSNNNYMPNDDFVCLLDWACHLQQTGHLMEFIDEALKDEIKVEAAETMVKVALLCTNASASVRPTMSEVVNMLEGKMAVPDVIPGPNKFHEDLRFKAVREFKMQERHDNLSKSHSQKPTTLYSFGNSSVSSSQGYCEITHQEPDTM